MPFTDGNVYTTGLVLNPLGLCIYNEAYSSTNQCKYDKYPKVNMAYDKARVPLTAQHWCKSTPARDTLYTAPSRYGVCSSDKQDNVQETQSTQKSERFKPTGWKPSRRQKEVDIPDAYPGHYSPTPARR